MTRWYVWGDFAHTIPERVGDATLQRRDDAVARAAADGSGFAFEHRVHNGFQPWAAVFEGGEGPEQEFAFAADPVVRGWKPV